MIGSDNSPWKSLLTFPSPLTVCVSTQSQWGESETEQSCSSSFLHNYLSVFPSDVSVTVTPASALRGNTGGWCVPASITRRETTARDVTPFTRTDPGPGPRGTLPTSVWVSSCFWTSDTHTAGRTSRAASAFVAWESRYYTTAWQRFHSNWKAELL